MRLYRKLRGRMAECDVNQSDIAYVLKRSGAYTSSRFRGTAQWELSDVYAICKKLGIPAAQIAEYFPEKG